MTNLMQECARKLGIRKSLPIICMNGIDTPCLYGIVSPKLLLPKSLVNRLNNENMRHIFIHELSHYKRNDILINWLAVAAPVSYTHLRAHETRHDLVCRLLLEKKKKKKKS